MSNFSEKFLPNEFDFSDCPSATVKHNLKNALSFDDFLARNNAHMLDQSLSEYLNTLLAQKGLRRADVIRDADLDKGYVHQIFNGDKKPSREKLLSLAFGMHLNEEETQRMLKLAGHSELYARVKRDALILFAIQRGMSLTDTDKALYKMELPTLRLPE